MVGNLFFCFFFYLVFFFIFYLFVFNQRVLSKELRQPGRHEEGCLMLESRSRLSELLGKQVWKQTFSSAWRSGSWFECQEQCVLHERSPMSLCVGKQTFGLFDGWILYAYCIVLAIEYKKVCSNELHLREYSNELKQTFLNVALLKIDLEPVWECIGWFAI